MTAPTPAPRSLADRLAGVLLGLAVGDALGFVVEAEPPDVAAAYAGQLVPQQVPERSHPAFSFGQYSDDTQLARELLLSVREAGGWNPVVFAGRLGAFVAGGGLVGGGSGTIGAGLRLAAGVPWDAAGTAPPYAGNGSAMRVAPLGVLLADDPAALRRAAIEQSRVTHRDPRCAAGAVAIAGAAALAARSARIDPTAILAELTPWVEAEDGEMGQAVAGVRDWLTLSPEAAAARLHASGLDPHHAREWRGISAFVVPSVAWSLYAFLRTPDDYWAVVRTAIAVGGDTDTMAAMAGALAGARLGAAVLPPPLLERLTDRGAWGAADLDGLARDCAHLFTRSVPPC
jgi:ADP-ribosylglycohydrolase